LSAWSEQAGALHPRVKGAIDIKHISSLDGLIVYCLKGASAEAADLVRARYGLDVILKDQGRIAGKRFGTSESLGRAARRFERLCERARARIRWLRHQKQHSLNTSAGSRP